MNYLVVLDNSKYYTSTGTGTGKELLTPDEIFGYFLRAIEVVVRHFNFPKTSEHLEWHPKLWMFRNDEHPMFTTILNVSALDWFESQHDHK